MPSRTWVQPRFNQGNQKQRPHSLLGKQYLMLIGNVNVLVPDLEKVSLFHIFIISDIQNVQQKNKMYCQRLSWPDSLGRCGVSELYGRVLVAFSPDVSPASVAGISRGSDPLNLRGHTAQKPHNTLPKNTPPLGHLEVFLVLSALPLPETKGSEQPHLSSSRFCFK
uniref:Uncharacterized protein n=1 Tax=Sphaerodactylus townsendi TaxID=933632 RepID=A0ACB8EE91_9SAUR